MSIRISLMLSLSLALLDHSFVFKFTHNSETIDNASLWSVSCSTIQSLRSTYFNISFNSDRITRALMDPVFIYMHLFVPTTT